jgi:uncharacterized protein YoaH (UPF0181 family)
MSSRKPNSNAVLPHLPMEQQQALVSWLLDEGMSYRDAVKKLAKEYRVRTNHDAVFNYYHDFCVPELLRRRAVQVGTATAVMDEARSSPGGWTEAALENLGQMAFEMSMRPGVDPKDVKAIFTLVLKSVDQKAKASAAELEREKFELLKKKAEFADEVKKQAENREGGITAEDMREIERKLKIL